MIALVYNRMTQFQNEGSPLPSEKSARVVLKRGSRNRPVRNALRTHVKKAQDSIDSVDGESAARDTAQAIRALDKAVTKGIIHKKNSARRKSRLMIKLNKETSH